ncbi:MAG: PhoH family protein [Chitinophagales bacterium]|nr:PhoH family protein [Bacteroidota bacterium]MCB9042700.1 PhoH family protein [Chitinophagales bacterium]
MKEILLTIEGVSLVEFFGINNEKLTLIKRAFPGLKINHRGNKLTVSGNEAEVVLFENKIESILLFIRKYGQISIQNIETILEGLDMAVEDLPTPDSSVIVYGPNGNTVRAKTPNQKILVETINENDVVFAVGPAGTGKTFVAVAMAVKFLKNKLVKRIILTRPAVEAGESLGYLPGDLKDKIDPYLRPLYDSLDDLLPKDKLKLFMENRVIEIAPLAYMRGRTLNNAFIILDEAQNATNVQLKMFLTRLGPSAKCVITGDMSQIDLPHNQKSGLRKAIEILEHINGIGVVRLSEEDVVRHRLVKQIIRAYDKADDNEPQYNVNYKKGKRREEYNQESPADLLASKEDITS